MNKSVLLTGSKLKLTELNALALYSIHYELSISIYDKSEIDVNDLKNYDIVIGFGANRDRISKSDVDSSKKVQHDKAVAEELFNDKLMSASYRGKIKEYFDKLRTVDSDTRLRSKIGTFTYFLNSLSSYYDNNIDNIKLQIELAKFGIIGIFSEHDILNKSVDTWNACDFSIPGVAINKSLDSISNWKELAKMDEVNYFLTSDKGTSNWSIISYNSNRNPLPESDLYFWIHASKFMAKFDTFEKATLYLKNLI